MTATTASLRKTIAAKTRNNPARSLYMEDVNLILQFKEKKKNR